MDVVAEIDDMTGGDLLDHAAVLAATQHRCELEILKVAVRHAYLHHADSLDSDEARKPGREKARRVGGQGTPEVSDLRRPSWLLGWGCRRSRPPC